MKKHNVIVLLLLGIFFLGNITVIEAIDKEGKIHKNVFVEEIDLSGLTKKEAKEKIDNAVKVNEELKLIYENKIYKVKLSSLGVKYNSQDLIEEAYNMGREESIIDNIKTKIKMDMGEKCIIKLKYKYDEAKINEYISYIEEELNIQSTDATIKIEDDFISIEKEKIGKRVDKDKLKETILNKIDKLFCKQEKIHMIAVKPKYLYKDLVKIDTVLGSYETCFSSKKENRASNIKVAARATSGIIINTNEEFSFNNYTNKNEIVKQLKNAPVIKNGKLEEGLGGGMCQVSSTIYNAALYSGLEITNIRNHSIPSAYVQKGRDATVSTGKIDLKFKNNYTSPILIVNKVDKDRIISTIYGNKQDKKDIEVITEIVQTLPNKHKAVENNNMYEGEKSTKQKGRLGYKVNTFRVYKDSAECKKELIYESYYPPMDDIIIYGTKKKTIHENIDTQII